MQNTFKRFGMLTLSLFVLFSPVKALAGKVTLSTYYPAPFGGYERMKLVPRAKLADTYCQDNDNNRSTFFTEDRTSGPDSVRYCLNDVGTQKWLPFPGVWTQNGTDKVYLTDNLAEDPGPNNNLKVGIGTTSPVNILDVNSGIAVGASYAGTNIAPLNGLIVENKLGIGTTNPATKLDVAGGIKIGNTENTTAGVIRWTGDDFEGYNGTAWVSLTAP